MYAHSVSWKTPTFQQVDASVPAPGINPGIQILSWEIRGLGRVVYKELDFVAQSSIYSLWLAMGSSICA